MALRRIWSLEVWLLIAMTAILMLSITRHTEHTPHWSLWFAAGLLAFFMTVQPKIIGAIIIAIPVTMAVLAHGFDLAVYSPLTFAGELAGELLSWIYDTSRAGIRLVWTFTSLTVFLIVYLQLLFVARGRNIAPLVLLGFAVYTYLWYNRYADVESSMFMFFALAFPAASFLYIRNQSRLDRMWYKAGILGLSVFSAFAVSIAPWDLDRLEVPEDFRLLTDPHAEQVVHPEAEGNGVGTSPAERVTGYSPGSTLGGSLTESHETVMRLELVEGMFPSSLYLRGRASDYYTGSAWEKREAEPAEDLDEAFAYMEAYESNLTIQVDYLEAEGDLFGFFPPTDIEIAGSEDDTPQYEIDSFGNLQVLEPGFAGEYLVSGKAITRIDLNRREPRTELEKDPEELAPFMQVPEDLPGRVEELAAELTEGTGSERAKAERIENYLRGYPYTRETPELPEGEDFVDHFLFELEEGYCSYYASAMVILLRLNDIPARYVEGYRVDHHYEEYHLQRHPDDPEMRQSVRVINARKSNAHAWVEAFLQGYGWVVYEPTARYGVPLMIGEVEDEEPVEEEEDPVVTETDDEKSPFGIAAFLTGAAVLLGLFAGASYLWLYVFFSRAGTPEDLYARVVKVRAAFSSLPRPRETPGMIAEKLKAELPVLTGEFEQMKVLYHSQRYANNGEKAIRVEQALASLPLRAVAVYRGKMGFVQYARGLFKLFLLSLFPRRMIGKPVEEF